MDLNKLIHVHLGHASLRSNVNNQVQLLALDLISDSGLRAVDKNCWNLIQTIVLGRYFISARLKYYF